MGIGMTVDVRVHTTVKEFILNTNGCDLITPSKHDWIWLVLKQHLDVAPINYVFPTEEEKKQSYIRISLLDTTGTKVGVKNKSHRPRRGRDPGVIYMNTLFRNYLSEVGQNEIAKHLRNAFKECFHNYVLGALDNNPDITQKEVIYNFCERYRLTLNEISEEMLKKSWYRSDQKKILDNDYALVCPAFF